MQAKESLTGEFSRKSVSLLRNVDWSPDDSIIFALFTGENPKLLNAESLKLISEVDVSSAFDRIDGEFLSSWSPDGASLALCTERTVCVVDVKSAKVEHVFEIDEFPVRSFRVIDRLESDKVISRLRPIPTRDGQREMLDKHFRDHEQVALKTLSWMPTGKHLLVGTSLGAQLVDVESGEVELRIKPDTLPGNLEGALASPDGRYAAGIFYPDSALMSEMYWNLSSTLEIARPFLTIWNAETGQAMMNFRSSELPVQEKATIVWSPGSRKVAWVLDNRVMVFDIWKQSLGELLRSQEQSINQIGYSPKGDFIALYDSTLGVVVYDTVQGAKRMSYRESVWGTFKEVERRRFSWAKMHNRIAVASAQFTIDLWDLGPKLGNP